MKLILYLVIYLIFFYSTCSAESDVSNSNNPSLNDIKIIELHNQSIDQRIIEESQNIDNQEINNILTVNGVRFSLKDGSWGLIRASSNKPSLVIVTESPTSEERKKNIFYFIDSLLQETGKIGEYDQKIWL